MKFLGLPLALVPIAVSSSFGAELKFQHHFIDRDLPARNGTGDYGLTTLVDIDKDGDLDFVCGGRGVPPARLYWYEFERPDQWRRHPVGTNYQSDVGLAALDVDSDGDGDTDICSKAWGPRPWNGNDGKMHVDFLENLLKRHAR